MYYIKCTINPGNTIKIRAPNIGQCSSWSLKLQLCNWGQQRFGLFNFFYWQAHNRRPCLKFSKYYNMSRNLIGNADLLILIQRLTNPLSEAPRLLQSHKSYFMYLLCRPSMLTAVFFSTNQPCGRSTSEKLHFSSCP